MNVMMETISEIMMQINMMVVTLIVCFNLDFNAPPATISTGNNCNEICGDGRRYNDACDDGNT